VPLVSIADLSPRLTQEQLGAARRHDGLINYMYLPPIGPDEMPASLALLYMPFTLDHDLLMSLGRRITQLALVGAQQLHRKLAWYATGLQVDRTWFRPALDYILLQIVGIPDAKPTVWEFMGWLIRRRSSHSPDNP
jgi:hypothetical protein